MVRIETHYLRRTNFAIGVIALVGFIAGMTGLLYWLAKAAKSADPQVRTYVMRLAAMATALVILSAALLVAVVARYVASRLLHPPEPFKPMGYVDAWTEAGRRLKPQDAPPVRPYEQPDQGSPEPGPGEGPESAPPG